MGVTFKDYGRPIPPLDVLSSIRQAQDEIQLIIDRISLNDREVRSTDFAAGRPQWRMGHALFTLDPEYPRMTFRTMLFTIEGILEFLGTFEWMEFQFISFDALGVILSTGSIVSLV